MEEEERQDFHLGPTDRGLQTWQGFLAEASMDHSGLIWEGFLKIHLWDLGPVPLSQLRLDVGPSACKACPLPLS